jgi:hypothetical protein
MSNLIRNKRIIGQAWWFTPVIPVSQEIVIPVNRDWEDLSSSLVQVIS